MDLDTARRHTASAFSSNSHIANSATVVDCPTPNVNNATNTATTAATLFGTGAASNLNPTTPLNSIVNFCPTLPNPSSSLFATAPHPDAFHHTAPDDATDASNADLRKTDDKYSDSK